MEPAAGEDVTGLSEELATTLRRVLSESAEIKGCLNQIRAEGYLASVVVEATIGLTPAESPDGPPRPPDGRAEGEDDTPPKMTALDKKFLRSLKITVDDEE